MKTNPNTATAPEPQTPPSAVSHRNHFDSAACLTERHITRLPVHIQTELRPWLMKFTESVIRDVAMSFATGAQRGIDQTASLLCDPDYYATRKERRKRERERNDAYQKEQDQSRLERQLAPTAEQIEQEMADLEQWIVQEEENLARHRARLGALKGFVPKHVRITEVKRRNVPVRAKRPIREPEILDPISPSPTPPGASTDTYTCPGPHCPCAMCSTPQEPRR